MIFGIRTTPLYRPSPIVRDPKYTRYVKRFPCVGCGKTWRIDPCHCGPHGTSQKASDLTCIPLCRRCHQSFDASPQNFAESRGLDVGALQRMFQRFYRLEHGTPGHWPAMPEIRIVRCACGTEDFSEELAIRGRCAECGRQYGERAA